MAMELGSVWRTVLWTLLALLHGTSGQRIRCDTPAEVVFVLDASKSIKPSEWTQQKDFVGILIDSLEVKEEAVNVGVVVYSTYIGQVIHLHPFKNSTQLKAEIPTLVQTREVDEDSQEACTCHVLDGDCHWSQEAFFSCTDTARGIARMREMMRNQARDNAKKIAVVITDGRSDNTTATIQEAMYARQLDGITMIALGIGNETFRDELDEIARNDYYPDQHRLYMVTSFSELSELHEVVVELRRLICVVVPDTTPSITTTPYVPTTTPQLITPDLEPISCPRPADVLFLLDGSHSITDQDWAMGRVFVTTLINSLEVDQEAIHAGIIVFSSNIGDTVPLKPFLDKASLKAKASTLNQPPIGTTNTALGLRRLRAMFREQGRAGIPQIGLVITDGASNNVQDTINEAMLVKGGGIVLVVVGVGKDILGTELDAMATSRDTLFNVTDFSALIHIVRALREIICISTDTSTVPTTTITTPTTTPFPELCQECLVKGGIGYNSFPADCSQYVVCSPMRTGGYRAEFRHCPFGLFWSSQAVACMDAAYVQCPADPCRGRAEGWSHSQMSRGCGEYWVCGAGGRSLPRCCPQGQRFSPQTGCFPDPSCSDSCSLQWTLDGSGSCTSRPNPGDPFSFLHVIPGQGHVVRPCTPGAAYIHSQCACVHHTSAMGCTPTIHYTFDATFDDHSPHRHSAHVQRVLLTRQGTAYFNRTGHVRVDTVPSDEYKDRFMLKIRYRVQPDHTPEVQWNDHYKWGLQEWFSSHQNQFHNLTFTEGRLPDLGPEPSVPSGQKTSTLEKVIILHNGTVLHKKYAGPDSRWPHRDLSGLTVTKHHLGEAVKDLRDTAVMGGVVFVPSNKGQHVLVLSPATSPGGSVQWEIVSKEGRVAKTGTGQVPLSIVEAFQLQLQPEPTVRWFITTADGTLLNSGTGRIPQDIKNLFSGFKSGKLVKVYQVGETTKKWTVSRPDGSGATGGQGAVPEAIRRQLKLDRHLKPEEGMVKRWAVLSSAGHVLDTGTGDVPTGVMQKYSGLRSGLVVTDTSGHWQLNRPDGTFLVAGSGALPPGVRAFLKGSMVMPSLTQESSWTVRLPNGTSLSGKGPIPDHIRRLFEEPSTSRRERQQTRWYMIDGQGQLLESGYGRVPHHQRGQGNSRVVQQSRVRGSNLTRWELRDSTGALLSRGDGQPPTDVFKVTRTPTLKSKANTIRHQGSSTGSRTNQANNNRAQGGTATSSGGARRWTVTLPDGSIRSGLGEIPADLRAMLDGRNVKTIRRWTVTLPDGSQRTGTGEMPADLKALLGRPNTGGSQAVMKLKPQHRWTITMPDGSKRSGTGDVPAHLQALLNAQRYSTRGPQTERRWSITLPNGTVTSGTGDVPAHLQELLNAGRTSGGGVRTQKRWSITLPDGSRRSGVGEIPADLSSLLQGPGSALLRGRRAIGELYQDVVGNCGPAQTPSFLLSTSARHVKLLLRTTHRRSGATLTLPITQGMNDVKFIYDGRTLTGVSNGVQKATPLTGPVVAVQAPVVIGKCRRTLPSFRGEIDEISISSCLP